MEYLGPKGYCGVQVRLAFMLYSRGVCGVPGSQGILWSTGRVDLHTVEAVNLKHIYTE